MEKVLKQNSTKTCCVTDPKKVGCEWISGIAYSDREVQDGGHNVLQNGINFERNLARVLSFHSEV